jgi:hypothetical protein
LLLSQKNTEVASPDTHHGIAAIAFASQKQDLPLTVVPFVRQFAESSKCCLME